MLKITELTLHNTTLIPAIRGMRNPMNSWKNSDSYWQESIEHPTYMLGAADYTLMQSLVDAGADHSKFMRMLIVSMDITAPLYWWKEFDTYKVGVVRNSCSTMHKIHNKEFTTSDFSCDSPENIQCVIDACEELRKIYLNTNDKKYWRALIQLLPESYNQKATVMLNYQVLRNMYHARKNHKLTEWHVFCRAIESLPYSELITMED